MPLPQHATRQNWLALCFRLGIRPEAAADHFDLITSQYAEREDGYHNLVHIVSGIIALYFGFAGSLSGAKAFCLLFGVVYLGLGFLGWFLGIGLEHTWHVGPLHLARVDHGIHVLLGVVFLAGGLFAKGRS